LLIFIWLIYLIGAPKVFTNIGIYTALMTATPMNIILAVFVTLIIISGEIDLSFPSIMGFAGLVFAFITLKFNNLFLGFIIALIYGALAGLLNGFVITRGRVPSIVLTLGTMYAWQGLAVILCKGIGLSLYHLKDRIFVKIFVGRILGFIPAQMIWAIAITIIVGLILNRHRFGSYILNIGDNSESAKMMGIDINKVKTTLFGLMGVAAAFSGIITVLYLAYYWPTQGTGSLLPSLSAVFVGGTSVFGGVGSILGTFIGALVVGSLDAGIVAIGLGGFWVQFIYGLIIIIATLFYARLLAKKIQR
jgi:simple sugar transport system permease protein